jgi:replicative superfamily II helicase
VHLLGEERGPVLEVIVSRMRLISEQVAAEQRAAAAKAASGGARKKRAAGDDGDGEGDDEEEEDESKGGSGGGGAGAGAGGKGSMPGSSSDAKAALGERVRFVALSTAVANAADLADWLGVGDGGCFNFRPSVRPVPLRVHIQGFPGKHYCPRMATMNKPTYAAIKQHSPTKPVLVFVSSRRQTRLTALDLISYCAADEEPRQFLRKDEAEMASLLEHVHDGALKHTLAFGIGIHHAGLAEFDRNAVEELFVSGQIQVRTSDVS